MMFIQGSRYSRVIVLAGTLILMGNFAAGASHAASGVVELNQVCAVQTGCFSADAPGFPITIDGIVGRSYLLTSDLIVPDENTSAIVVAANAISIDLNNFSIIGSACADAGGICPPTSGSGSGIQRTSTSSRATSVKDGSIIGMGSRGLILGDEAQVSGVRARLNRLDGIFVGLGSKVSRSMAFANGSEGIFASSGSTVSGNTVYGNGDSGIFVTTACTALRNTSYGNGGDGIRSQAGSMVLRNVVRMNTGYGLNLAADSGYRKNVVTSSEVPPLTVLGGVNMLENSCQGATTCP